MKEIIRNDWMEFNIGLTNAGLKYELGGYFDKRHMIVIQLLFFNLFVHMPWGSNYDECDPPRYGFAYFSKTLWWHWDREFYTLHMPWDYDWVRTSMLRKDGTWEHEIKGERKDFYKDYWKSILWSEIHAYVYVLKNGTEQNVNATIMVSEREWRQKWLRWTRLFAKVCRTIDISFDSEVGEGSGSWKGGVLGCGYDLKKGESPLECLGRMESERKFNR